MRTLQEAINNMSNKGGAGDSLRKHLTKVGITTWDDITRDSLYDFRDALCKNLAPSTAKTIAAYLKALLNRYSDAINLPSDRNKILSIRGCRSVRTFLTPTELRAFEQYTPKNEREKIIQLECLVEAFTGARVSDVLELTEENVYNGALTYTSKKTNITASVPVSDKLLEWIGYLQLNRWYDPSMVTRERIIRRIAKKAGIIEPVTVFMRGITQKGPKYEFITSHNFRISFVTNLRLAKVDFLSISRMAGHTSIAMTERYCSPTAPELTDNAMAYFRI